MFFNFFIIYFCGYMQICIFRELPISDSYAASEEGGMVCPKRL